MKMSPNIRIRKSKILTTKDILKLIRQDKSLYNRGLDKCSNNAILNAIKTRFKISNFAFDMNQIREELKKDKKNIVYKPTMAKYPKKIDKFKGGEET